MPSSSPCVAAHPAQARTGMKTRMSGQVVPGKQLRLLKLRFNTYLTAKPKRHPNFELHMRSCPLFQKTPGAAAVFSGLRVPPSKDSQVATSLNIRISECHESERHVQDCWLHITCFVVGLCCTWWDQPDFEIPTMTKHNSLKLRATKGPMETALPHFNQFSSCPSHFARVHPN